MENNFKFTEAENKIRKKWLFWSTKLPASIFACCLIFFIFVTFTSLNFIMILGILFGSLLLAGSFYLNYYCAYKNQGTILLLIGMVGISLNIISNLFNPKIFTEMKSSIISLLIALTILCFQTILFYYSYQLRKINKEFKKKTGKSY